ncbi:MAG TPA: IS200/IS605 family transposase [Myxococcales bacterium]|jgi:REP element-mobilizing transposase RayT
MPYSQLYVHVVWATYLRNPLVGSCFEEALWASIGAYCREAGASPIQVGGMADHVHVLASVPPSLSVSRLVWAIKGSSSHDMAHRIAPGRPFRWQEGYGAFTLRKEDSEVVASYILDQRAHHAAQTTKDDWERWESEHEPEPTKRRLARLDPEIGPRPPGW